MKIFSPSFDSLNTLCILCQYCTWWGAGTGVDRLRVPRTSGGHHRCFLGTRFSPAYGTLSTQNLCRRQLIMRSVSLTLTGLVSAWWRGEAPSAILAKPLLDCVTVFCLRQCKSWYLKVCEIWKNTGYFQTNWISCIINRGVRCDVVSDVGHTHCRHSFLLLTSFHQIGGPPLRQK